MCWTDRVIRGSLPDGIAVAVLVCSVCICVVSQMLGVPVTLLDLLTSDTPVESPSEGFSIPPITPNPDTPTPSRFSEDAQSARPLPIFSTAVFHPPQG